MIKTLPIEDLRGNDVRQGFTIIEGVSHHISLSVILILIKMLAGIQRLDSGVQC